MRKSVWGVLAFLSPSPGSPSPFLQAKAAPSTQTSSECSPFVLVHVKTPSLDWIHLCQVMRMGLYSFFLLLLGFLKSFFQIMHRSSLVLPLANNNYQTSAKNKVVDNQYKFTTFNNVVLCWSLIQRKRDGISSSYDSVPFESPLQIMWISSKVDPREAPPLIFRPK